MITIPEKLSYHFITPEEYHEETRGPSLRGPLAILPCRSGATIAGKISDAYNRMLEEKKSSRRIEPRKAAISTFPDAEIQVEDISQTLRGLDVYIIQQLYDPVSGRSINDNLMEALILTDAIKRHAAKNISLIIPYHPYSRQDKMDFGKRQPISAKLIATLFQASGITQIVTGTLHVAQIKGFYDIPVDEIDMIKRWVNHFSDYRERTDAIVISPDPGATVQSKVIAGKMKLPLAVAEKARKSAHDVEINNIVGDLEGKKVALVFDDIISTAGSVYALGKKLMDMKLYNPKILFDELHIAATHGLFSMPAVDRLQYLQEKCGLKSLTVTNSIPHSSELAQSLPYFQTLPLEEELAVLINRIHYEDSLREAFVDPYA
ncbi:MAG: ribose-phosphate diphosphokinase [Nanoarchaeota archaeon]